MRCDVEDAVVVVVWEKWKETCSDCLSRVTWSDESKQLLLLLLAQTCDGSMTRCRCRRPVRFVGGCAVVMMRDGYLRVRVPVSELCHPATTRAEASMLSSGTI
jgi:hypothetical protein